MGFMKEMKRGWKAADTETKIELVLNFVCDIGAGMLAGIAGKKLTYGQNRLTRILCGFTMTGLGIAAGDIAGKALHENYGKPIAVAIDKSRARAAAEAKKEEEADNE